MIVVDTYMLLFLLYLVKNFSQNKIQHMVKDTVLGRKIPYAAYILNKKLYKQA